MEYKDYYKILEVAKDATAADIKKSYKKLALQYHPDRNSGDKNAETRFKEINEANQVLGNAEKRKKYDELGENWDQYQQQGNSPGGFYQQRRGQGSPGNQGFGGYQADESQFADFFDSFFGSGNAGFGGRSRGKPRQVKGNDLLAEIQISLNDAFHGTDFPVNLGTSKLNLKLKPGLVEGQRLRLKGKGEEGANGGAAGDLILTVHVSTDARFERRENDLYFDQFLDIYTAILGGKIEVVGIDKTVRIDIQPGTDSNKTIRLKGMGMPVYDKESQRGDAFVRLLVTVPKDLTPAETSLFQQLRDLGTRTV